MCIAIIKNKGADLPEEDVLRMCFKNNPDGAGFVLNRNGMNYIYKGFFTFNGFLNAIDNVSVSKDDPMLIHFRVATHGKINIENCHPFPIEKKFVNMTKPILTTESDVMVHNGKLLIDITNPIYSDSMHFAKALCNVDRNKYSDFIEYIIRPTDKNKRGNRIGIITKDGTLEHYGVGWIEKDGILYSNDSFKLNGLYQSSFKKKCKTTYNSNKIGFNTHVFDDLNKCDNCGCLSQKLKKCYYENNNGRLSCRMLCQSCILKEKDLLKCDQCDNFYPNDYIVKILKGKDKYICTYCDTENDNFGIELKNGKNMFSL